MIQVKKFTFNPFRENSYVLYDNTKECIVVDPGCFIAHEEEEIAQFIEENELQPMQLINTHAHIDHVLGNSFICNKYDIGLYLYDSELPMLEMAKRSAQMYEVPYTPSPEPTGFLNEGDQITFGESSLNVIFVPGHAPDHIALLNEEEKILIGGDILFQGSIGRTDLPGGNHEQLISGIKEKIFSLNEDIMVYSGHGNETTIGIEKRTNPFF